MVLDGGGRVDRRVGDEQDLPAEPVGNGAGAEGAGRRAERGPGHQVAGPEAAQVVGHEVERGPDVRGVVPEQEPAQAGQDGELPVEPGGYLLVEFGEYVSSASLGLRHRHRLHSVLRPMNSPQIACSTGAG
jgi:hypothetical protein